MTSDHKTKSLGQAIDEMVSALSALPDAVRPVAIKAACDHLGIPISGQPKAAIGIAAVAAASSGFAPHDDQLTDIRTLKDQKKPSTHQEMACLVAYYLQTKAPPQEKKDTVNAEDLNKYFIQANFPLPKRMVQLLVDSKAAGYFDSAGQGAYRLNPVGHNLVAHNLPRGDASQPAKGQRSGSPRKTNKSAKRNK